jgi:hypothetical protein
MEYFGVTNYCFKFRHFAGTLYGIDDQVDVIAAHLTDAISHRIEAGEPVEVAERNALAQWLPPQKLASEFIKAAYKGEQTRHLAAFVVLVGLTLIAGTQPFSNFHLPWIAAQMLLVARVALMSLCVGSALGLWALSLPFSNRSARLVRAAANFICPLLGISTAIGTPTLVLTGVILAQVGHIPLVRIVDACVLTLPLLVYSIYVMTSLRRAQSLLGRYLHADRWVDEWPAWLKRTNGG